MGKIGMWLTGVYGGVVNRGSYGRGYQGWQGIRGRFKMILAS